MKIKKLITKNLFKRTSIISFSISVFLAYLTFFLGSSALLAATSVNVVLEKVSGEAMVGNTVTVSVLLHNENRESINAIEATVDYPKELLSLTSISKASSLLTIWAQEPKIDNSLGQFSFAGGTPQPFNNVRGEILTLYFKALAPGQATITTSETRTLLADGFGTETISKGGWLTFQIIPAPAIAPIAPVRKKETKQRAPSVVTEIEMEATTTLEVTPPPASTEPIVDEVVVPVPKYVLAWPGWVVVTIVILVLVLLLADIVLRTMILVKGRAGGQNRAGRGVKLEKDKTPSAGPVSPFVEENGDKVKAAEIDKNNYYSSEDSNEDEGK